LIASLFSLLAVCFLPPTLCPPCLSDLCPDCRAERATPRACTIGAEAAPVALISLSAFVHSGRLLFAQLSALHTSAVCIILYTVAVLLVPRLPVCLCPLAHRLRITSMASLTFSEQLQTLHRAMQLSHTPAALPCRDAQHATLKAFLTEHLIGEGKGGALYISGAPGTGQQRQSRLVFYP
jgi:hypothetical protein